MTFLLTNQGTAPTIYGTPNNPNPKNEKGKTAARR